MHPAAVVWQSELEQLDRWFAEVAGRHPDLIPCRAGCSACCHGPFDISAADALLLREGLMTLPLPVREGIRQRGQLLLEQMRDEEPLWGPPWDVRQLGEEPLDALCDASAAT